MVITRRNFLKWSGIGALGTVVFAGCGIPEEELLVQSPATMPEDDKSNRLIPAAHQFETQNMPLYECGSARGLHEHETEQILCCACTSFPTPEACREPARD